MKNLFATLVFVFSLFVLSSLALAACPGDDCTEPAIPDFQEFCPDSNCDGAWGTAWVDGNHDFQFNTENAQQVWAEECTAIEVGAIVGAPQNGTASMQNEGMQSIIVNSQRPDGSGGIAIRDTTIGTVNALAENGAVQGGVVFGENHFKANMYDDVWKDGGRGEIKINTNMAAMVCDTPGGGAMINTEHLSAGFQHTKGNGFEAIKSFQASGRIGINNQ